MPAVPTPLPLLALFASATFAQSPCEDVRLLLSEVVVTPRGGERIAIHNPSDVSIPLEHVYLTDATFRRNSEFYWRIVEGQRAGGGGFGDFHARFPAGAVIAPHGTHTIALAGSDAYLETYGQLPTYELFEDGSPADMVPSLREALPGTIKGQGELDEAGETVILYCWDGKTDLVTDLDIVSWGKSRQGRSLDDPRSALSFELSGENVDKTGLAFDGPDPDEVPTEYKPDTAVTSQVMLASEAHAPGFGWRRTDLAEGKEKKTGGNGAGGHDETSEDLSATWEVMELITPVAEQSAPIETVALSLTAHPGEAVPAGGGLTYVLNVQNLGETLRGAEIELRLPEGVVVQRWVTPPLGAAPAVEGDPAIWWSGDLEAGTDQTWVLLAHVQTRRSTDAAMVATVKMTQGEAVVEASHEMQIEPERVAVVAPLRPMEDDNGFTSSRPDDRQPGFLEVRASMTLGADGQPWQLVERVRQQLSQPLQERVLISATVEAQLAEGRRTQDVVQEVIEGSALGPVLDAANCSWPEPESNLFGIDGVAEYMSVDRLYLDWYHPKFDLRVGRQALQWGSGQLVNPTDPYPQVLFNEPWKPRAGVNAARITVPFGSDGQIQGVVGASDVFDQPRAAARGTVLVGGTDISVLTAWRPETSGGLVGADLKGELGVGFWVEAALVGERLYASQLDSVVYESVVVGIDYSFPVLQQLVLSAQYYRNGAGTSDPAQYDLTSRASSGVAGPTCDGGVSPLGGDASSDPFAPVFLGQDYATVLARLTATRDLSLSVTTIQNLNDGTGLAVPTLTVRPNGWLELSMSGQVPYKLWGDGGELKPAEEDLRLVVPTAPGAPPLEADLSGLASDATLIFWTRVSF